MTIRYSPLVRDALDHGYPVLALETANITHSMPRPLNLEMAQAVQQQILASDVVPAAIAVIDGDLVIGLTDDELARIANEPGTVRVSISDLPVVETRKLTGGTALAAAVHLAHRAGIKVCATTGLGGVHRASKSGNLIQESSDLMALSTHPLVLVTSGVRPMLDVAATLERLETMGIPVLGYRTSHFPSMYQADTGYEVDHQVTDPSEVADIARARDELGLGQSLLVANPTPPELQVDDYQSRVSEAAEIASNLPAPQGPEDTQVLLASFEEATKGRARELNTELYRRNVALGAQIAKELATTPHYTD
ncbi:pseudouridine-5'-phosphate glycosidase [Propionimicrobium sp. PCR01-08-3]|uniref:pseudouridine-5'-phosphate glycosidase n=1 Tax=Propionimicrobium sp. PCR01-08-3 TaxID=3052086 RepID=UPI00255CE028|nr:pseudouridine-5'-phosphate glycosidase [Propionimicrobium sp. PCR01-08-3]WIY83153.1 pseudouridine-5'-phosphate glycosidase [Propionimicrobium sp. PCR01-08-3]